MKYQYISRTMLLLVVLLANLNAFAQTMVGDGFGGRPGYDPVNIVAGYQFGFAICDGTKQAYVWGTAETTPNNGSTYSSVNKIMVSNVNNVRQVSFGGLAHTYIKDDGTGYVFGKTTPYNTALITNAYHSAIAATVAFVKTDGTVWVGGPNNGAYGNGTLTSTCPMTNGVPSSYCLVQVPGITNAKRVAVCNGSQLVILLADGTVKMTGGNSAYMPAALVSTTPITVPGLSNIVDIKAGEENIYALTSSGQVYAWGTDRAMGTGVPQFNSSIKYMPTLITFPTGAAPIKAIKTPFAIYAYALDDNGNLYGWGSSGSYAIGLASNYLAASPTLISTNVRDALPGRDFSYIVKNDNTIWGAGNPNLKCFMNLPLTGSYTTHKQMDPSYLGLCAITSFTGMPPCVAGTTAPALTPTTATNSCPSTTVDLTTLAISGTTPSGAKLIWSTHKTPTSAADTLTTAQKMAVSTAGKYYALYYDATNACYSPADSVTITLTACTTPIALTNTCPTATVNLTTAVSATNMPSGASITWHTGTPATAANKVATPTAVSTSGTYYLAFFDATANCYSDVSQDVTVTITSCAAPLTTNTPPAQTATTSAAKTGNAATELAPTGGTAPYVYSNGAGDAACVAPSGATALTGLTVNADGTYSYTAPATAGTYYFCIKVCDSATPTAQCVVKTYTLTVTAAATCTVTGIAPTFIKN